MRLIEINKIAEASEKISALVRKTECQKSNYFSKLFNTNVFYKREDQQKIKSFKIRGAYNKILSLDNSDLNKGLVCASAGNHAQGFALSCSYLNKRGTVFIPKSAPQLKIDRVVVTNLRHYEFLSQNFTNNKLRLLKCKLIWL